MFSGSVTMNMLSFMWWQYHPSLIPRSLPHSHGENVSMAMRQKRLVPAFICFVNFVVMPFQAKVLSTWLLCIYINSGFVVHCGIEIECSYVSSWILARSSGKRKGGDTFPSQDMFTTAEGTWGWGGEVSKESNGVSLWKSRRHNIIQCHVHMMMKIVMYQQ